MEYFSKDKRIVACCISNAFGQLINLLLPVLVYLDNSRSGVHFWTGLIGAIAAPLLYYNVPESSRWLISNNKSTIAEEIFHVSSHIFHQ